MNRIFDASCAALFRAVIEFLRQLAIEENHQLTHRGPVFRPAESEHVDAALPGDLAWPAA